MKTKQILPKILLSIILSTAVSLAHAISVTDVTFNGENADAAALLSGNDSTSSINALGGSFDVGAWTLLDKTDDSATQIEGVTFTISANAAAGEFTLSWDSTGTPGLPLIMDFVFVDKAATNYGAYLFEDELFTSNPLTGTGTFNISWTNNGGNTPNLSHISIYGHAVQSTDVPEPATLSLIGLGLLALGITRRKKQAKQ